MKKIAILSSGNGDSALEAAALFNEGNRVRIPVYVTNTEISQSVIEKFKGLNIEAVEIDADGFPIEGGSLADLLRQVGVDMIVMDNFTGLIPEDLSGAFDGRIISVGEGETIQRAVVRNLITEERKTFEGVSREPQTEVSAISVTTDSSDHSETEVIVNEEVADSNEPVADDSDNEKSESADEAWSKVLHLEFDKEKAATPPPVNPRVSAAPDPNNHAQRYSGNQGGAYSSNGAPQYQQGNFMGYNPQFNNNQPSPVKMPPSYLIWSVLATVFCCFIPGIVGIFFSSQVSSRYFRGDYAGAEKASRNAQIWIIVSFVLGMITSTLYFPLMMVK